MVLHVGGGRVVTMETRLRYVERGRKRERGRQSERVEENGERERERERERGRRGRKKERERERVMCIRLTQLAWLIAGCCVNGRTFELG